MATSWGLRSRIALGLAMLLLTLGVAVVSVYWTESSRTFSNILDASRSASSRALVDESLRQNEARARLVADQITNAMYYKNLETVTHLVTAVVKQESVTYIRVFDASGAVIQDGSNMLFGLGAVLDDADFRMAVSQRRLISTVAGSTLHTTVPITIGSNVLGGVRIGVSLVAIQAASAAIKDDLTVITEEHQSSLFGKTLAITASVVLLGIAASFLIFKDAANAIITLTAETRKIGQGSYEAAARGIPIKRRDEIGELARSVEKMVESLASSDAELREALVQAQAANHEKSKFLSSMSHELRTPLNVILGFGQILDLQRDDLTEDQIKSVGYILRGGEHLLGLVNGVLDLAMIEVGQMEIRLEPIAPAAALRQSVVMAGSLVQKYGVDIDGVPNHDDLPLINVDSMRLQQILLNLLSNAIKYNRPGGRVTIGCEATADGMVRFRIADTGNGISEDKVDRLFLPFDRLGHEASHIEGTGIGLSITKELVEMMGGRIGFESQVGKGSVFWVDFPVAAAGVSSGSQVADIRGPEPKTDPEVHQVGQTQTVLYVEDNAANAELMRNIVALIENVELCVASDAEAGLTMARDRVPGLILMDINLPGMSGLEAMRVLKDDATTANVPVVAVSADAQEKSIEKAMEQGFDGYITKPFELGAVIAMIEKSLPRSPAAHQGRADLSQEASPVPVSADGRLR